MQIIDEGLFIKILPDEGMVLTDKATETMKAEEIDLAISDNADNYKDIPIEPEPTKDAEQKAEAFDYLTGRTESETTE